MLQKSTSKTWPQKFLWCKANIKQKYRTGYFNNDKKPSIQKQWKNYENFSFAMGFKDSVIFSMLPELEVYMKVAIKIHLH